MQMIYVLLKFDHINETLTLATLGGFVHPPKAHVIGSVQTV